MNVQKSPDPVTTALVEYGLPRGTHVLVAVSGGADSVGLLDALHQLSQSPERGWHIRIGHINHELRGEASEADEAFVRELAASRGLDVDVQRVDTATYAREHGVSIETAARLERYRILEIMLDRWSGDLIATGHTRDDQAETLLLHLIRGSGLGGLTGIQPLRDRLVRPILSVSHEEMVTYLQHRQQGYRLDESNSDTRYARNRIRTEVVPAMERINPAVSANLARTASLLQVDAEFEISEAMRAYHYLDVRRVADEVSASLPAWRALHPALRRMTLRLLVQEAVGTIIDVESQHIAAIEFELMTVVSASKFEGRLPHGLTLYVNHDRLSLCIGERISQLRWSDTTLPVPGAIVLPVGRISAQPIGPVPSIDVAALVAVSGPCHALCRAEVVGSELTVRSRKAGDVIRPLGFNGSKKVQDLFVDRKIPVQDRDTIPVLANADHIVWIAGHVLDRRVAAVDAGTALVHLTFEPTSTL